MNYAVLHFFTCIYLEVCCLFLDLCSPRKGRDQATPLDSSKSWPRRNWWSLQFTSSTLNRVHHTPESLFALWNWGKSRKKVSCLDYHIFLLMWMVTFFVMPPKELWGAYSNCTVRPSVRPCVCPCVRPAFVSVPLSCPVDISYILWGRNFKLGVWMHLGMAECRIPFSGHCDLDLWPSF